MNKIRKFFEDEIFKFNTNVIKLNDGKVFGDMGLLLNKPRSATILCLEDCHLAVLSKNDYINILKQSEQQKINNMLEFFQKNMFPTAGKESIMRLIKMFEETKTFHYGEYVFKEGN